jgi:superfamily II DNA or RNA helicase
VLAHRDELIRQAVDKLKMAVDLECAVEKADERGDGSMFPVVVASVQTLMRQKRLVRFNPAEFACIIIDEAHHALADSYQGIFRHFDGAKMLGVTATPDRGDKKNLGKVFESIAFSYGLRQAVLDGHLARITAQTVPLKIDMSEVRTKAGDYDENGIGDALGPYLEAIADEVVARAADRKTLAFLPLRATSRTFTAMLKACGMDARHVDGESEDRADVLAWLKTPGPKVCCNAMLLTEGFDEPSVDCIVPLRPTKSRALYTQIVGRGTRLYPGKDKLLLLDFLWQTEQHDLCRPCHLVATRAETAAGMTEIQEREAQAGTEQMDLLDLEQMANTEELRKRHEALAEKLKEQARKKARLIDPVLLGVMIGDGDLTDYQPTMRWEAQPPTEAQIRALERFGVAASAVTCKGHASMLMGKMIERSRMKLASVGKLKVLARYGFEDLGVISEKEANGRMDRIMAGNWQQPENWSFA